MHWHIPQFGPLICKATAVVLAVRWQAPAEDNGDPETLRLWLEVMHLTLDIRLASVSSQDFPSYSRWLLYEVPSDTCVCQFSVSPVCLLPIGSSARGGFFTTRRYCGTQANSVGFLEVLHVSTYQTLEFGKC